MPPRHTKTEPWALSILNTFCCTKLVCSTVNATIWKHCNLNFKNVPSVRVRISHLWGSFHLGPVIGSRDLQERLCMLEVRHIYNYQNFRKETVILHITYNSFTLYKRSEPPWTMIWPQIHKRGNTLWIRSHMYIASSHIKFEPKWQLNQLTQ